MGRLDPVKGSTEHWEQGNLQGTTTGRSTTHDGDAKREKKRGSMVCNGDASNTRMGVVALA